MYSKVLEILLVICIVGLVACVGAILIIAAIRAYPVGASISQLDILEDHCDLIEVNHFYRPVRNEKLDLIFIQVIFWDFHVEDEQYHVTSWRLMKWKDLPRRDLNHGGYVLDWVDHGVIRRVRSVSFVETFTLFDPELHDRRYLPKDKRAGLTFPRIHSPEDILHGVQ